ncbi:hypothetical protein H9Y04_14225 [Streptomyces sp. TRM66268-LWL]|uniref:Uncharacterized protein n=2 Tax=Streptomyces polyasparticus TaxID=2767826 RepID=A0ABR7SFS4_9ACTN|nr:hypothetical protein [Streptomyces polyasparticus]
MDPGFIPGITPAGRDGVREESGKGENTAAEGSEAVEDAADTEETTAEAEAPDEAASDGEDADASGEAEAPVSEKDSGKSDSAKPDAKKPDLKKAEPEKAKADKSGEPAEGPSFEARDYRGTITVDASGIGFTLDDQATDFTWDEVVAVEQTTARFAKRFTVTVHTKGNRWYPNEVQAPDRATLTRWTGELDDALDAYFEE